MELLTDELRQQLPPLYSQEHVDDPQCIVKFFTPDSNWTWYAYEFDGEDLFFGWVVGFEMELGYFSLTELQEARGPLGLPIERDLYFTPIPLSEVKKLHQGSAFQPMTLTIYVVGDETLDDLLTYDPETEENLSVTPDNPHPIAVYHLNGHFVVRRWNGNAWEEALNNDELEPEVAASITSQQYEAIDNDTWFPILKTIAAKSKFPSSEQ